MAMHLNGSLHRDLEDLGVVSHFLTCSFRCFAPLFCGLSIVVWGSASCFDEGKEMHPLAKERSSIIFFALFGVTFFHATW
jgi:hypothetical protein